MESTRRRREKRCHGHGREKQGSLALALVIGGLPICPRWMTDDDGWCRVAPIFYMPLYGPFFIFCHFYLTCEICETTMMETTKKQKTRNNGQLLLGPALAPRIFY